MPVLPIVLIVVALLLAAPFLTWVAFSLKQTAFIVGLAALPFLILLGNRPNLWMILVAWIFGSNIRVVLGGTLTLFTVLSAGLAIILLARTIISKRTNPYGKAARRWGIGLLLVIIVTMYMRGVGFNFLGGDKIGGMRYILILVPIGLFVLSSLVTLSRREWKYALYGMCITGLLPGIAEFAIHVSGGSFYHLYYLIQPKTALGTTIEAAAAGADLVRYKSATDTSRYILLFALLAFPGTGKKSHLLVLFAITALAISGLSGHRQNMVYLLGVIFIYGFFISSGRRIRYSVISATVGLVGMMFLYLAAPFLPFNIQRSISWMPKIPVSYQVKLSALGTTDWRILVWGRGMEEVPRYFWLGKGYAYDLNVYHQLSAMQRREAFVENAVLTINYHNGPLGLVIGLGIFGVITAAGLFFTVALQQSLMANGKWADPVLERFHLALLSMYLARIPSFLIISGNVHTTFPDLVFLCLLMQCVARTELRTRLDIAQKKAGEETQGEMPAAAMPLPDVPALR